MCGHTGPVKAMSLISSEATAPHNSGFLTHSADAIGLDRLKCKTVPGDAELLIQILHDFNLNISKLEHS